MLQGIFQKDNPAQGDIVDSQGSSHTSSNIYRTNVGAYKGIEVVNRGTNMIADGGGSIKLDISDKIPGSVSNAPLRPKKLNTLLNFRPNPYMSAAELKRVALVDLVLNGNAFFYWDGAYLYNLPASEVTVNASRTTFIESYEYNDTKFSSDEIIQVRDNAVDNLFRGISRLDSARDSVDLLVEMSTFHTNYFKNGTVTNIILKTDNVLSPRMKERKELEWIQKYSVRNGGQRPIILDGEFDIDSVGQDSVKELDFSASTRSVSETILIALGIPPILLAGGNNANIAPNQRLLYTETILPLVEKIAGAFELFFGFDIKPVTQEVLALRPELREEANYYSSLVNAGILTRNEAREVLRFEKSTDEIADQLILPANVAGSASDAGEGGRPSNNTED